MQTILLKRGATASRTGVTPASGEPIWDTQELKLYVGDGLTAGGKEVGGPGGFPSQVAKTFFSAPNATAGAPSFRLIVASDIPTLNQHTTGNAGGLTGMTATIANLNSVTGILGSNAFTSTSYLAVGAFTDSSVTSKLITGYLSGAGTVSATDTLLQAINKLNGNIDLRATLASPTFTGTVSGITATMVGLGNVNNTSDAAKPVSTAQQTALNLKADLASPTFTGVVTLPAGTVAVTQVQGDDSTKIATTAYTDLAVASIIASADAMVFKGTIGTGGTLTNAAFNSLTTYNAGWTYRVIQAGTIKGIVCEIGDLLLALADRTGTGAVDADWSVAQTNLDGAVTGPASAVDARIAVYSGTSGKIIADGGVTIASLQNQNVTHTGEVTGATALTITNGAVTLAKMANMATASLIYRRSASAGAPEVNSLADLKTDLGLVGSNSGDQTISISGVITASGSTGGLSTTFSSAGSLSVLANSTNASASPSYLSAALDFQVLRRSGTALAWGSINLASTNAVTGILALGNGGTGRSTLTANGIIYGLGTAAVGMTGAGAWDATNSVGQLMSVNASGVPTWTNIIDGGVLA